MQREQDFHANPILHSFEKKQKQKQKRCIYRPVFKGASV